MSKFWKRDKKAFEEYAIQVAIITLKHITLKLTIAMEKFHENVKQLGITLTLSSLGINYIFKN